MLRDASPTVVLTTSSVIGDVVQHVTPQPGEPAPSIVEVDLLDLDAPTGSEPGREQSKARRICNTRLDRPVEPAGVMVTHRNCWPISSR